jgi:hypothetical protein
VVLGKVEEEEMRRRPETVRRLYATKCPSSFDTNWLGAFFHASVMLELRSSAISVGALSVALTCCPRNTERWHSKVFPVRPVRDSIVGGSDQTDPLAPIVYCHDCAH